MKAKLQNPVACSPERERGETARSRSRLHCLSLAACGRDGARPSSMDAGLFFSSLEGRTPSRLLLCPAMRRFGFTLIELLAAMAILMLIILGMGRIFTDSAKIWKMGTKHAYGLGDGRAIMDLLVRELTQSYADGVVSFRLNSGQHPVYGEPVYGYDTDELYIVPQVRTPGFGTGGGPMCRHGQPCIYFVTTMVDDQNQPMMNRYRLVRCRKTGSSYRKAEDRQESPYENPEWWQYFNPVVETGGNTMEPIADNIAAFEMWAYSEKQNRNVSDYDTRDLLNEYKMPLWVDIYLEMFSEDESIQMAELWKQPDTTAAKEYRFRHAQIYTARVYFPNRLGYSR